MTTGEKLQSLRKQNNYTQEELADIMGVSRQSISKWESDIAFPETEKLITLSKLYKCSIDYLLNSECNNPNGGAVISKKPRHNRKRLPLVLTSIGTYLLVIFFYFTNWFNLQYNMGSSPWYQQSRPVLLFDFFVLKNDVFTNSMAIKYMAIILFAFAIITICFSVVYLFLDTKPFSAMLKATNCTFLFGLLILLTLAWAAGRDEITFTPVPYIVLGLSVLQVLLQYLVKRIRVTR